MSLLPGWDSADTTTAIAHNLHITAIVVLGLLVVAEAMALIYDSRKEHLVSIAMQNAETQRKSDEAAAKQKSDAEAAKLREQLAAAQKSAEEARKTAASVEQASAARHLTESQRSAIFNAIAPFTGNSVDIVIPMGDTEAKLFAGEFVSIFRKAGWNAGENDGINQAVWTGPPVIGIQVTINQNEAHADHLPPGAGPLIRALIVLGLTEGGFANQGVQPGKIELRVGSKPLT